MEHTKKYDNIKTSINSNFYMLLIEVKSKSWPLLCSGHFLWYG